MFNNNPKGKYTIMLYCNAAELAEFSGAQIQSMGKSAGAIREANTLCNSYAPLTAASAYSSDYAYSATFNSGFSDFGFSGALITSGPLP